MKEFVDFLGDQPPYDALEAADLERLAATVEVEYVRGGGVVVPDGSPALDHLYVVRAGSVEVLDRGQPVDLLGPGDTFGHVSVLSGLPPAMAVRAVEDTLLYRIADPRTVLAHPERLQFAHYGTMIARRLLTAQAAGADRAARPVRDFLRPLVWCEPDTPVRRVAELIGQAGLSCALVRLPAGVGIVTDHDFRHRVATGEVGLDAPVADLASAPALSVGEDTTVATAFLQMVEHGVHHLVVMGSRDTPVGVVRVVDLASVEVRDPLLIRRAVESAVSLSELGDAVRLLPTTAVELYDARVPATRVGALLATVIDAVLRKVITLREQVEPGLEPVSWLVLGSVARREPLPFSDVDTGLVWRDPSPEVAAAMLATAARVLDDLEACGMKRCDQGANATNPLFARSLPEWKDAVRAWMGHPTDTGAGLLCSMLADSRPITEVALGRSVTGEMLTIPQRGELLRMLSGFALGQKPPTGFMRDFVVHHSGERRGQLDLKKGGLLPVTQIARWLSLVHGDVRGSTPERLLRARAAGLLDADECDTLTGAFEQIFGLLMANEVEAIRSGAAPSTFIAPGQLDSLTRRYLREAFRAIIDVQSRLSSDWMLRLP